MSAKILLLSRTHKYLDLLITKLLSDNVTSVGTNVGEEYDDVLDKDSVKNKSVLVLNDDLSANEKELLSGVNVKYLHTPELITSEDRVKRAVEMVGLFDLSEGKKHLLTAFFKSILSTQVKERTEEDSINIAIVENLIISLIYQRSSFIDAVDKFLEEVKSFSAKEVGERLKKAYEKGFEISDIVSRHKLLESEGLVSAYAQLEIINFKGKQYKLLVQPVQDICQELHQILRHNCVVNSISGYLLHMPIDYKINTETEKIRGCLMSFHLLNDKWEEAKNMDKQKLIQSKKLDTEKLLESVSKQKG